MNNASVIIGHMITVIPGDVNDPRFKPMTVMFGEGVNDFADILASDVDAFVQGDFVAFARCDANGRAAYVNLGWTAYGCQRATVYGSLIEWQASPG